MVKVHLIEPSECFCNLGVHIPGVQCRGCVCDGPGCAGKLAPLWVRQKVIQKTVRIPSSEYTMNIGALNVWQPPMSKYYQVNWNQSSDRKKPHESKHVVPTRGSSTRGSITRLRPGSLAPGKKGVDIKHNSYARYLAKKKGQKAVRLEGDDIDRDARDAHGMKRKNMWGGKIIKHNIVAGYNMVNGCSCKNKDHTAKKMGL